MCLSGLVTSAANRPQGGEGGEGLRLGLCSGDNMDQVCLHVKLNNHAQHVFVMSCSNSVLYVHAYMYSMHLHKLLHYGYTTVGIP